MSIKDFFSGSDLASMTRLCMFLLTLCSIAVAIIAVIMGRDLASCAALVGAILTPAFIGKAAQSFAEKN